MEIVNRIVYADSNEFIGKIQNDAGDKILSDITKKLSNIDFGTHKVTFYFDGNAENLFNGERIEITFTPTLDDKIDSAIKEAISNI